MILHHKSFMDSSDEPSLTRSIQPLPPPPPPPWPNEKRPQQWPSVDRPIFTKYLCISLYTSVSCFHLLLSWDFLFQIDCYSCVSAHMFCLSVLFYVNSVRFSGKLCSSQVSHGETFNAPYITMDEVFHRLQQRSGFHYILISCAEQVL